MHTTQFYDFGQVICEVADFCRFRRGSIRSGVAQYLAMHPEITAKISTAMLVESVYDLLSEYQWFNPNCRKNSSP